MIAHREAYETGRPDFIKGATVGAVFGSTVDRCADRSVLIPVYEIVGEMKSFPAGSTSDSIRICAVDNLAMFKRSSFDGR